MTYAREMAKKALYAGDAGRSSGFGAIKAVEEVIAAVIERCAQEAERGIATAELHVENNVALNLAARRIRALAATPAGVGAEAPAWDPKDHANHPASYCEICQSHAAPAGTGGRR